jgi:hypothetical protein
MKQIASGVLVLLGLAFTFLVPISADEVQDKVVRPFNGTDLKGWKPREEKNNKWVVGIATLDKNEPLQLSVTGFKAGQGGEAGTPELINDLKKGDHGTDLYTEQKFGDCAVEIEVMVAKNSNSGIYLMGEYEVQVLDSSAKEKVDFTDMGAIYGLAAPKKNACKKPGEWQKFVIDFQAPRFKDGKKIANAKFLKVTLNGEVLHENFEATRPTGGQLGAEEVATGPLLLQGNHGPVAFRNIKITPKEK